MNEWVQFWITAVLLTVGLCFFAAAVLGNCRFYYVMNRIHAAGLGDTMGLFCTVVALMVSSGSLMAAGKLLLPLIFLWITSPISGHFLGQVEYYTNPRLYAHMDRK